MPGRTVPTYTVGVKSAQFRPGAPGSDPLDVFASWYAEAETSGIALPEAMALATATPDGRPSSRLVLLKGYDASGFTFFTNFGSRKARELDANPRAALTFHWAELERQVRIEGPVTRVDDAESDDYFATRPRGSQVGAWASPQSEPLASRDELERKVAELRAEFGDEAPIPRPPDWGGYRVAPERIEFWQGRPDRLHDRWAYVRTEEAGAGAGWRIRRLAP